MNQITVIQVILKNIDYLYEDEKKNILGYEFSADSYFQGYAKVIWKNNRYIGLDIYSIYNTHLYKEISPTYQIFFFERDDQRFIFDGMKDDLFVIIGEDIIKADEGFLIP